MQIKTLILLFSVLFSTVILSQNVFAEVIDNSDSGFTTVGDWPNSHGITGYYGSDYRYSLPGSGTKEAVWSFSVLGGQYEISAQWASYSNRASDAGYTVFNNGVELGTVYVDQRFNGGQFNLLGSYDLEAGTLEVVLTDNADGCVIADAVKITYLGSGGNQAPDGVIDTPTGDVTILVGEPVDFTGTGTDPDGHTPLTYLWSFGDGSGISDSTEEDPGVVQFNNPGTFTVTFTVTDSLGLSDPVPATVIVSVQDSGGSVVVDNSDSGFTTVGDWPNSHGITGYYGSDYRYSLPGSGTKEAVWSFSVLGGQYEISAQWASYSNRASDAGYTVFNNGVELGTVYVDQRFNGGQFNLLGSYDLEAGTLEVVLTDNADGCVIADAVKITYLGSGGNQAPDGVIDTPTGDVTILVGEPVDFTGTGTDPDGHTPLTYLWSFGDGSGISDSTEEDPGLVQFNNVGTYTVTYTVTDSEGLSDPTPGTVLVTVSGNQAPDGVIDTPTGDVTILVGESVDFTGTGTDPDGHTPLTYLWSFGDGSGISDSTEEDPGLVQFNNVGTYTVTYTVTDSEGLSDPTPGTVLVTVSGNQAPDGVIDTPTGDVTILVGEPVDFTGTGTDPDGHTPLTYLWSFGDGSGISDSTEEDPGVVQFNNPGTFTVTFTVTDSLGLSDPVPATVIVSVQDSGGSVVVDNSDSGFTTVGDWPNSHGITGYYGSDYRYSLPGSGTKEAVWSFSVLGGQYEISAQWASYSNRASDAGYTVFNNGVELGTVYVDQRFNGGQFNLLGSYDLEAGTLEVVLTDNADGCVIADAVKITYLGSGGNQAPDGVIDTPTGDVTILVGEPVDFTGTGTDPDGHTPLTYLWSFGDGSGISDSTEEDPGLVQFNNVGTYTVTYTVTDSEGLSDPTPGTVLVTVSGNQAPDGVIDTPTGDVTILVGESVDFTGTGTDPDGHTPLTYLWSFGDGSGISDSTEEDPGLVQFNNVGTYTVTYTVTDSEGLSDPTPGTVLVTVSGNQAPDGVIDTPTGDVTILVGEPVDFTGTGTDPDGHTPLTYLWSFGDGSGISDSTEEDPGVVQFNNPGTFTVTFTVTDSLGLSDPVPATVIVSVQDSGGSVVVDNSDSGFTTVGDWPNSHGITGYYGSDYRYSLPGSGTKEAVWSFSVLGGQYEISAQWASYSNRASDAGYTVFNNGVELGTVYVDQRFNGGQFNLLGSYDLEAGTLEVVLTDNADGCVIADAVQLIKRCATTPCVSILQPYDHHFQSSDDLYVLAQIYGVNATQTGWGVKFVLDNSDEILDYESPYEAYFQNLSKAEHMVEALLVDEDEFQVPGESTYDQVNNVAVGDYYVAMGDSITEGYGDDNASDDISNDGRNSGGGYEPILNNLLTAALGYPHTIINEGVGGTVSSYGASSIQAILEKHPEAQRLLVQYGTNDARPWLPVSSGLGLESGDGGYPGTFKDNMQQIIDAINADGRETCLAKAPIALGDCYDCEPYPDPDIGQRSVLIREYNEVVDELFYEPTNYIDISPPDFYSYFNYYDPATGSYRYEIEYADNLHPNGQGYLSMAEEWLGTLN